MSSVGAGEPADTSRARPALDTLLRRAVAITGIVFVALVAVAGWQVQRMVEADDALGRSATALSTALEARLALSDMDSAVRGFVLSGEERFLAPYDAGIPRYEAAATDLTRTSTEDPEIQPLLTGLVDAAEAWRVQFAERVIADAPTTTATVDPSIALDKELFDEVRAAADRLQDRLAADLRRFGDEADQAQLVAVLALIAAAAVVLGACVLIVIAFVHHLSRPLASVIDDIDRIAERSRPALDAATVEEVHRIERALDALDREIDGRQAANQRMLDSIAQNASLAFQLSSDADDEVVQEHGRMTAALRPAEGVVAGDTFRLGELAGGRLGVVLVDVCGHGAESALQSIRAREQLWAGLRGGLDPAAAVAEVDRVGLTPTGNYLTALVLVVDLRRGAVGYCCAGHPPPLLVPADGAPPSELETTGPVVGPIVGARWANAAAELAPGDRIIAYTDGVTEARERPGDDFFGIERVLDWATSDAIALERPADGLIDAAVAHARRLDDDATVVIVERGFEAEVEVPASADLARVDTPRTT
ncbi:MAG: SpoIIE family protein phosphatase [Actinomycetota bacterium]